ncbi:hypothetical protein F0344_02450 [Streptomyces finlayi]|uniref:Uncharacterized protein n=1 Tax=Streptomyces finlayi TaxID=67296 RepID=A0A7G7BE59_9ACTN|nr:hypothetical protein [Streptomyces finlayi]QNE73624.1 hypothetical protein F0344_02450 [Streptomyces finlayi]
MWIFPRGSHGGGPCPANRDDTGWSATHTVSGVGPPDAPAAASHDGDGE